ncbi:uncharacterized protein [Leuresthes tenuis]|uniref:uncharacterized protein n=1 Tax=Leuresthes tenuis TaxID=355514 RepID=UPI003B509511
MEVKIRAKRTTKVNLVLVGMTGTGKSACGNTILGEKYFTSKSSSKPVTTECQWAEKELEHTLCCVIDTPDIFNDDTESSVRDKHVKKCKKLCDSGFCVYLLVVQAGRFTAGERDVLTKLEKAFGSRVKEQTIILFTHGDGLDRAGMSLNDFLHSCQPQLLKMLQKCGYRCVLFENRSSTPYGVQDLMMTVDNMLKGKNVGAYIKSYQESAAKACEVQA